MNASSQSPVRPQDKPRRSGVVVPHAPRWHQRAGGWLVFALIRTVSATLRYRWDAVPAWLLGKAPGAAIYCVWHNRLALCIIAYNHYVRQRDRRPTPGMAAMVSASRDGGFLTSVLEAFRVEPVRGSSSRRGPQALLELTTWAEKGYDLAITPDGPRGPRYVVQDGVVALAQLTGLPIVPFSYHLKWKIQIKSWDRFQIPLPFARCEMRIGKPIRAAREISDAAREELRQELERSLVELSGD